MNAIRIGKKIRCARTVKGMSQDDLAEKVGRHRPAISRLEAAAEQAPRLTAELIEDLCRELDMDPWAFFDNSNRGYSAAGSPRTFCALDTSGSPTFSENASRMPVTLGWSRTQATRDLSIMGDRQ